MKRDAWDRTAMHTPVLTHADAQYHWVMKRTMVDLDPGEDTRKWGTPKGQPPLAPASGSLAAR